MLAEERRKASGRIQRVAVLEKLGILLCRVEGIELQARARRLPSIAVMRNQVCAMAARDQSGTQLDERENITSGARAKKNQLQPARVRHLARIGIRDRRQLVQDSGHILLLGRQEETDFLAELGDREIRGEQERGVQLHAKFGTSLSEYHDGLQ